VIGCRRESCTVHVRTSRIILVIRSYRLVPVWISTRDHVAKAVQRLYGLVCRWTRCRCDSARLWRWLDDILFLGSCWWRGLGWSWRSGGLWLGVKGSDLELLLVLLQDAFIVVLPELLGGVLAGDSLEDLLSTRVFVLILRSARFEL